MDGGSFSSSTDREKPAFHTRFVGFMVVPGGALAWH